ncbi:MAG: hypothetical protein HQL64_09450 [Magnetococcales bacterium]|nr:hypothetical protein [Magnetococcales bacterium]
MEDCHNSEGSCNGLLAVRRIVEEFRSEMRGDLDQLRQNSREDGARLIATLREVIDLKLLPLGRDRDRHECSLDEIFSRLRGLETQGMRTATQGEGLAEVMKQLIPWAAAIAGFFFGFWRFVKDV